MTHPSQTKRNSEMLTSKDQMNIPVQTVSQPSAVELAEMVKDVEVLNPLDEFNNTPIPETSVAPIDDDVAKLAEVVEATDGLVSSQPLHVNELSNIQVDDILSASIIARPLVLPNHLDQRARDPKYRLRWVNFKANGGARFEQCAAAGFRIAKPEEVVGVNPQLNITPTGIKYHDTILMLIEADRLLGAYKYNFQRSLNMVSEKGALDSANKLAQGQFGRDMNNLPGGRVPSEYMVDGRGQQKVKFYVPEDK